MAELQSATRQLICLTLLFLLSTVNVMSQTSPDSSDYQLLTTVTYEWGECIYNVSDAKVPEELSDKISKGDFFIYINLKFPNSSSFRTSYGSNIINPFRWVFASGGKGDLLLTLPFDFAQLSMTTLKIGVSSIDVNVDIDKTCLQGRSGNELVDDMVELIHELVSKSTDAEESKPFSVCIERQLTEDELDGAMSIFFPGSGFILFQTSTVYDCWADDDGVIASNPVIYKKYEALITCVFIVGIILALYSPIALIIFARISPPPPPEVKAEEVIAVHSDLPFGLKYYLLFAGSDSKWIRPIRWLVLVISFGLIPYVPVMAWATKGELGVRMEALNNAGVLSYTKFYTVQIVLEVTYCITAILLLTFTFKNLDRFRKMFEVAEKYRRYFFVVELSSEVDLPESDEKPTAYDFFKTMIYQTSGIVNFVLYAQFFENTFKFIKKKIGGKSQSNCQVITKTTGIYILILPFLVFVFLPISMLFYAFPFFYLIYVILCTFIGKGKGVHDILISFVIVILSVSCFFKFIAVFVYVSELILYTIVGFLTHPREVGAYVTVGVVFVGYFLKVSMIHFDDGYRHLMLQVVEKADKRDKALGEETSKRILLFNEQGIPFIKMALFDRVVKKYRPVSVEMFKTVVLLFFLGVFILLGFSTFTIIDGFMELSPFVAVFKGVFLVGLLPLIVLIVRSPRKIEALDKIRLRQLEKDLEKYPAEISLRQHKEDPENPDIVEENEPMMSER